MVASAASRVEQSTVSEARWAFSSPQTALAAGRSFS
jgi:hypothetical protein